MRRWSYVGPLQKTSGRDRHYPNALMRTRSALQGGGAGQKAPSDHDAGDPQPRAHLFHDQVARHLKDEVAPIDRLAEGEPYKGAGNHQEKSNRVHARKDKRCVSRITRGRTLNGIRRRPDAALQFYNRKGVNRGIRSESDIA
jgi:hypothetical protein